MEILEGKAAEKPNHGGRLFKDGQTESSDEIARLQTALADTARHASGDLATALLSDPARSDLLAVLAQFDPPETLLVLAQIASLPVPNRHLVLASLLAAGPSDSAPTLRAGLAAQTRQALLDRIFSPTRVQVLKRACRNLTKEIS